MACTATSHLGQIKNILVLLSILVPPEHCFRSPSMFAIILCDPCWTGLRQKLMGS